MLAAALGCRQGFVYAPLSFFLSLVQPALVSNQAVLRGLESLMVQREQAESDLSSTQ
jgi:hypothetical protein